MSNDEIAVTKTDKSKVSSINYQYFAKLFNFLAVKLKLLRKSRDFLILGVTNVTLVLSIFYHVQTA